MILGRNHVRQLLQLLLFSYRYYRQYLSLTVYSIFKDRISLIIDLNYRVMVRIEIGKECKCVDVVVDSLAFLIFFGNW